MKVYHLHLIAILCTGLFCAIPIHAHASNTRVIQVADASKSRKGAVRITGRVSDAAGEPAAGAMLKGNSGKKIECYALVGEDGMYALEVPDRLMAKGTVEISCMGFAPLTLTLAELAKNPYVELMREVSELDEFTVKGKGVKIRRPDWLDNAIIYEVNLRHASAERNLSGLAKRLPQLQELGVNVLCLMPIYPISLKGRQGSLGSPYAVADYKALNSEFGTIDQFRTFIKLAHLHDMRIIIDMPCGYSGMDHPWVSEHPEYYARTDSGQMVVPPGYTDVFKFDYSNPEWRREMVDALFFWVRETGVDGFRFAEAEKIPMDFWQRARKTVQHVKPVAFIAEASDPDLLKEAFDADYAWPMTDTFTALATTQGVNSYAYTHQLKMPETDARAIPGVFAEQKEAFPKGSLHLNMTGSYVLNAREGTDLERYGDAARAFAVLTYTLPGIPVVYAGQEAGHEGAFSLIDADSVPDYKQNLPMQQLYTKLNKLRRDHRALWQSIGKEPSFKLIETTSPHILAFERTRDDDRIVVVVNLSSEPQPLNFPGKTPKLFNMRNHFYRFVRELPAELQPWEFQVYRPILRLPRLTYQRTFGTNGNPIDLDLFATDPLYKRAVMNDITRAWEVDKENERRHQKELEDE